MTNFLTDCVFVGKEAEGPNQGTKTLFIASHSVDPLKLQKFIFTECQDYLRLGMSPLPRIYFGAGGKYGLPVEYFPLVHVLLEEMFTVIVEVNSARQIRMIPKNLKDLARLEIVLTFTKDFPKIGKNFCKVLLYVRHFKFVDEKEVFLSPKVYTSYTTRLNDSRYKEDRKVEI